MTDRQIPHGELILDIAGEPPVEFDLPPAGQTAGFHEQQLLLEMLADPEVAAALDALDARDAQAGDA